MIGVEKRRVTAALQHKVRQRGGIVGLHQCAAGKPQE